MANPRISTANISFTIKKIVYTPEKYSIRYNGIKFQTNQTASMSMMSSSNISAIDERFMIMLTGLEEDNVYQFTVDSVNCLGTTNTEVMNFTTLPTCKSTNLI